MTRKIVAVLLAVAAVFGASVATGQTAVAESNKCIQVKYPDGANMVWMCHAYSDLSGPTWYSGVRYGWNQDLAHGGHSDTMRFCDFGGSTCTPTMYDDDTRSISWTRTLYDTNTMYVKIYTLYGSTSLTRCVWWNVNGGAAVTSGSLC